MVYRKKRTYRKKRSTNRTYRKRFTRRSRYSKRGQKIYMFKRHCTLSPFVVSNTINSNAAYNFSLQDLPNYTEFTNLYDMYKINAVKLTMLPQMTQNVSLGTINNPIANARVFSVIDYNDSVALSTPDQAREYQSCKVTTILRTHKRYLKPKIQDDGKVYTPGRPWINCSSPAIDYYGVKFVAEPMFSTTSFDFTYIVEAVYYLSFKNVK